MNSCSFPDPNCIYQVILKVLWLINEHELTISCTDVPICSNPWFLLGGGSVQFWHLEPWDFFWVSRFPPQTPTKVSGRSAFIQVTYKGTLHELRWHGTVCHGSSTRVPHWPLPGANCTRGGPHGAEAGWILHPRPRSKYDVHRPNRCPIFSTGRRPHETQSAKLLEFRLDLQQLLGNSDLSQHATESRPGYWYARPDAYYIYIKLIYIDR